MRNIVAGCCQFTIKPGEVQHNSDTVERMLSELAARNCLTGRRLAGWTGRGWGLCGSAGGRTGRNCGRRSLGWSRRWGWDRRLRPCRKAASHKHPHRSCPRGCSPHLRSLAFRCRTQSDASRAAKVYRLSSVVPCGHYNDSPMEESACPARNRTVAAFPG